MSEHDNFVNSCCPLRRGPPLLVSGSDDGTAKVRLMGSRVPQKFAGAMQDASVSSTTPFPSLSRCTLGTIMRTLQVWDMRVKRSVQTLPEKYQVCAVAFADAGDQACKPYISFDS